ncbi:MAG: sulfate adenylyltransferase, partial [Nitrospina sp.]|nr:sulfate adenylyltransferase [Nitrospina sp.]
TGTIDSKATTVEEIVDELKNNTTTSERSGRAQDQENTYAMQKLRARGYM